MNTQKHNRMMKAYDGHSGAVTVAAVMEQIPAPLLDRLTGADLGRVMNAINAAYHKGRASTGAEVIDGDSVWVGGKLIPMRCIEAITSTESAEHTIKDAHGCCVQVSFCNADGSPMTREDQDNARANNGRGAYYKDTWRVTRWAMPDVVERS